MTIVKKRVFHLACRTRWLLVSPIKREPSGATTTPWGRSSWALVAGPAVAVAASCAVAGDGRDDVLIVGVDATDGLVLGVDDVDVAGGVERHFLGAVEGGLGGGAAVAGVAFLAGAGDGLDMAAVA